MKKGRRYIAAAILIVLWIGSLSVVRALLAPAVGAAAVNQMAATNAAYVASVGIASGANIIIILISIVFAALVVAILRSK